MPKTRQQESDEERAARLPADDLAAFTALYNRYWKRLLAKAYARLGNVAEAEEAVQDIFVRLWHRRRDLHLRFSFETYVQAALRYELLARAARRADPLHCSLDAAELATLDDGRTPATLVEAEELRIEIDHAIEALPEKCRLIFRLSREEGPNSREVAQRVGIAEKTVEVHLTKDLKALRDYLVRLAWRHRLAGSVNSHATTRWSPPSGQRPKNARRACRSASPRAETA